MVNTRSRAANSKELITRPLPTKRKADVLEDDIEADAESVLDPDEDLIQEITRRVADSRHHQDQKQKGQQHVFLEKMKECQSHIPGMFDNPERSRQIQGVLTQLRALAQRRREIDKELTELSTETRKRIRYAQRSLNSAIDTRLDDLNQLKEYIQKEM